MSRRGLRIPPRSSWPIPGVRPPWGELGGWGRVRRVVFWLSMLGNLGLIVSAETSGSDLNLKSDGTKRAPSEKAPVVKAEPQREQADEEPAEEKRDEPDQHEGTAAQASA